MYSKCTQLTLGVKVGRVLRHRFVHLPRFKHEEIGLGELNAVCKIEQQFTDRVGSRNRVPAPCITEDNTLNQI